MSATPHTTRLTLPATQPFSFAPAVAFVRGFGPLADSMRAGDEQVTEALSVDGHAVLAELSATDGGLAVALTAAGPLSPALLDRVSRRLTDQFGLAEELGPFYDIATRDAAFAPVLAALHGYRQVRFPSAFEAAVWAVLSSRSFRTQSLKRRRDLLETFSGPAPGSDLRAFPEAEQLAPVPWEVLDEAMHQRKRAQYVVGIAEAFAAIEPDFLTGAPDEAVEDWLLRIPGIGPWSAEFVMIRGMGRMDRLPHDKALLRAAGRIYGVEGMALSEERLEELAADYGPQCGYWAHYLRVYAAASTQG
jgi:DNA-3-methyladenine glycosylase II